MAAAGRGVSKGVTASAFGAVGPCSGIVRGDDARVCDNGGPTSPERSPCAPFGIDLVLTGRCTNAGSSTRPGRPRSFHVRAGPRLLPEEEATPRRGVAPLLVGGPAGGGTRAREAAPGGGQPGTPGGQGALVLLGRGRRVAGAHEPGRRDKRRRLLGVRDRRARRARARGPGPGRGGTTRGGCVGRRGGDRRGREL